jgi:DUF1680 family protein
MVGGYCIFPDGTFYGCCACIGAAGSGIIPYYALMRDNEGLILNFYEKGSYTAYLKSGERVDIAVESSYPTDGRIVIKLGLADSTRFSLKLRIPAWCNSASISIGDERREVEKGYTAIEREWKMGDMLVLDLPMTVTRILPPKGARNEHSFAAYKRGPLVLAADARLCDPYSKIDILCDEDGYAKGELVFCPEIPESEICISLDTASGKKVRLINYSSAGKTWTKESACAAWLYLDDPE